MSQPGQLFEVQADSPLLLLESEPRAEPGVIGPWHDAGLTVRVVRGRKMRTLDGLFDEMAAALQFPDYFGENWAAFDECLADMDWLPLSGGIAVLIRQPDEVLADAPTAELNVLVKVITGASASYAKPIESGNSWDRPAVPFHVVLQTPPGKSRAARVRWEAAGAVLADLPR